ncbi:MAG: type II toxin-antitoxin system VapC family toxin [Armatimonadota bacterium]
MKLFVDTSAFLALEDRDDHHHHRARRVFRRIGEERPVLVTSNLVLAETISLIGSRLYPKKAVEFGRRLHASRVIRIVYLNDEIERLALATYEKFDNARLSFVDCTSFELIRLLRLDAAFAFDEHFRRAGFLIFDQAKT